MPGSSNLLGLAPPRDPQRCRAGRPHVRRLSWRQALTLRSPQLAMVYGHLGICAFRLGESLTDDSQRQRFWQEAYADFESARAHGATLNPQIESFMERQRATIK